MDRYEYENEHGDANYGEESGEMHTEDIGFDDADNFIRNNRRNKSSRNGKHSRFAKKTAEVAALALVFGLVSGGAFQAVNMAASAKQEAEEKKTAQATATVTTTIDQMKEEASGTTAQTTSVSSDMTVQQVAESVLPAIVAINCTGITDVSTMWGNAQEEYSSCGTGIIVGQNDTELLIATNNHVVADSDTVSVDFIDDSSADALVKGTDADNDLAVIAVKLADISSDTMDAIATAELGDSDSLEVGEQVVAIGNALGYGQSVTTGIVSALNREVSTEDGTTKNLIQTDAAINPGNSGGALVNMQGQVIGINSAKYEDSSVEGMGFAIPVSTASGILDELMNRETRTVVSDDQSSYLGIQGEDITSSVSEAYNMPEGVYVTNVVENAPASEAGMQTGDIIVKFDGTSMDSMEELQKQMTYYASGETVTVVVERCENGEYTEKELSVTLGHNDSSAAQSSESQDDPMTQNGQGNPYGAYTMPFGNSYGNSGNGYYYGNVQ